MRSSYRHLCLLIAMGAATLQAATPIEGELPIELARYFVPGTWYSDLAPGLPEFTLPVGLELVGSHDQEMRKQVLFRIAGELDGEAARDALVQAITSSAGWERIENPPGLRSSGGFVASNTPVPPPGATLCNPAVGLLTLSNRPEGFVYLSLLNTRNMPACGQRGMRPGRVGLDDSMVDVHTPLLEVEVDTPAGLSPVISQSTSSGLTNKDVRAQVMLRDTSPRRLANDFARQMRRQGWRREANWRGEVTAGNSWTRQLDDSRRLAASIDIVNLAEDDYDLRLQVVELPRED